MKMLFEAEIKCKNTDCTMYGQWQKIRFAKLDDFFENPSKKICSICGTKDISYTSANRIYMGTTVEEAIQELSKLSPNAVLTINIPFPTCEYGTCFDYAENYIYDIFEVDTHDKVQLLYSPNKD